MGQNKTDAVSIRLILTQYRPIMSSKWGSIEVNWLSESYFNLLLTIWSSAQIAPIIANWSTNSSNHQLSTYLAWLTVTRFVDLLMGHMLVQDNCQKHERKASFKYILTHWGGVMHICISKLTIIGSDNGLLPGQYQAIIWTSDEMLLIGALWTNFSEILIKIQTFSSWKNRLKVSSAKWQSFCLGLNELNYDGSFQDS